MLRFLTRPRCLEGGAPQLGAPIGPVDHLALQTGQKATVPFRQFLIVCTNQQPNEVMDAALRRRMGYRLFLGDPTPERYASIFDRYAARRGIAVPPGTVERLLQRYAAEGALCGVASHAT